LTNCVSGCLQYHTAVEWRVSWTQSQVGGTWVTEAVGMEFAWSTVSNRRICTVQGETVTVATRPSSAL